MNISVRHSLIRWFVMYLQGRRQMCTFRKQKSECKSIKGGISQESKLGPLAFILKINQLANVVQTPNDDDLIKTILLYLWMTLLYMRLLM